ncbi:hypothetical protein [Novosphingobium sp.]|uniref:hypothetical protein n=1 Tax=Novosphingobium sp. TaxID=1874826 RepID=UPI002FE41AC6
MSEEKPGPFMKGGKVFKGVGGSAEPSIIAAPASRNLRENLGKGHSRRHPSCRDLPGGRHRRSAPSYRIACCAERCLERIDSRGRSKSPVFSGRNDQGASNQRANVEKSVFVESSGGSEARQSGGGLPGCCEIAAALDVEEQGPAIEEAEMQAGTQAVIHGIPLDLTERALPSREGSALVTPSVVGKADRLLLRAVRIVQEDGSALGFLDDRAEIGQFFSGLFIAVHGSFLSYWPQDCGSPYSTSQVDHEDADILRQIDVEYWETFSDLLETATPPPFLRFSRELRRDRKSRPARVSQALQAVIRRV